MHSGLWSHFQVEMSTQKITHIKQAQNNQYHGKVGILKDRPSKHSFESCSSNPRPKPPLALGFCHFSYSVHCNDNTTCTFSAERQTNSLILNPRFLSYTCDFSFVFVSKWSSRVAFEGSCKLHPCFLNQIILLHLHEQQQWTTGAPTCAKAQSRECSSAKAL